ncbi:TrkH family potassium uptake protein [Pseudaestuariivita rosea]|uniref:TrkH family potassium uptake protein n=1 Tax=Pseudaestuariivita rosea TaxID=2763263 RepID=UPI001ABB252B|nr:TrkH family potassium uptake protein [Pseudaestuariivita rosea]
MQKSAKSSGADALLQRARPTVVGLTLLKHMPVFPALFTPPLIVALIEAEYQLAIALAAPLILSGLLWLPVAKRSLPADLRRIEAMVCLGILFFLAAAFSVPAFMALGMRPVDGMFEAMSGITTTGLSVASAPDDWPIAAHVLRAWLQWCGGLAMATAVLALILDPGLPARQLGRVGIDDRDFLTSSRAQARQLLIVYVTITVIGALGASLLLPNVWEAIVVTLAAVSTGGFAPRSDSLASYSLVAQGYVIFMCAAGAVSLLFYILLARNGFRAALDLGSLQRVGGALAILLSVYALYDIWANGWDPVALYQRFLDLISGQTTAGYSTGPMPAAAPALLIFIIAMIVGADIGSTGGGLKITRIILLGKAVRFTFSRARSPDSAVLSLKSGGRKVDYDTLVALMALVLLYMITVFVIWSIFLIYDYPPVPALFDTVSTLSTVGLSTIVGSDLPDPVKIALTVGMWLGRLEFIAVLVLILPRTWFRRR